MLIDDSAATASKVLPNAAKEVYQRLHLSVLRRVAAPALSPMARGYHHEMVDAFEDLSVAETYGQVLAPLEKFSNAFDQFLKLSSHLVDLYSRDRPIRVRLIDDNTVLEDIHEALDQLAASEKDILRLREGGAPLGHQLQGFLRLEIALGHTLDLIAAAEDAGIHIGFDIRLPTEEFAVLLTALRKNAAALAQMVKLMATVPPAIDGALKAQNIEEKDGPVLKFNWSQAPSEVSRLRLYRGVDSDIVRSTLQDAYLCAGESLAVAKKRSDTETASLEPNWTLVKEAAPGVTSATISAGEFMPGIAYRLMGVSRFGVEGQGPTVQAPEPSAQASNVRWVRVESMAAPVHSSKFFASFDAVEVSWGAPDLVRTGYRLDLLLGDKVVRSTDVGPQQTSLRDRVDPELLEAGITYRLSLLDGQGGAVPGPCSTAALLRVSLHEHMELSRAGLADLMLPTQHELRERKRLETPTELLKVRQEFATAHGDEAGTFMQRWWVSHSAKQRKALLEQWHGLFDVQQRKQLFEQGIESLAQIHPWRMGELWLKEQGDAAQAAPGQ
jgi:hypothetical protein